jgi:hypothetical protein
MLIDTQAYAPKLLPAIGELAAAAPVCCARTLDAADALDALTQRSG